jgi:hypothetical protein
VPGLRERLYGNFRIDVGVFVAEMNRMGSPKTDWMNEYNCQLRRTQATRSSDQPQAEWWPIAEASITTRSVRFLDNVALPWLDRYPDKPAIIAAFQELGSLALGMGPAGGLDIADLCAALGRHDDAREILRAYVCRPLGRGGHRDRVHEYLTERGYPDLADLSRRQLAKRERVQSVRDLNVNVRIHWRDRPWGHVTGTLPADTVVQIDEDPAIGEQFVHSAPINYDEMAVHLVPESIRADNDFADYSVRVEFADVGRDWQRVAG